jgi:uncharacterized protein YjdB
MGRTADLSSRVAILSIWFSAAALASTTTLSTSTASAILGKTVTLTAAVTPSTATGKVTFYDGASVLGISTLSDGSATWKTALLTTGAHSLTARYDGDANNTQSLSARVSLSVQSLAAAAVTLPVTIDSNGYYSATYTDFNNDGKPDIVAVDQSSTLRVFLGNGDGTFTAGETFGASSFVVGDFNGDGNIDVAYVPPSENSVVDLLFGNGDGTFRAGPTTTTTLEQILGAADFDGNGTIDLFLAGYGGYNYGVMLGNGDGTFRNVEPFSSVYAQSSAIAIGDFNGDGNLDLVTWNLVFYAGDGDGTFAPGAPIIPNGDANYLAAVDVNGDGKLDLLASNYDTIEVLTGNGNGTFSLIPGTITVTGAFTLADFNGDGKIDILAAGEAALGNGDGTFQSPVPILNAPSFIFFAADLNNNGQVDLVGQNSNALLASLGTNFTTLTINASPNPATYGQPLTLSATMSPATVDGNVSFFAGASLVGSAPLVSGVANLVTSSTPSGRQLITANFAGNGVDQPSSSLPLNVTVEGAASSVSLESSSTAPAYGQNISLTASVTPNSATGDVTFYDGALAIAVEPIHSGSAVFATATLNTGAHSFSAQYDAGASYGISVSNSVQVTVTSASAGAFNSGPTTNTALAYLVRTADLNGDGLTDLVGTDGHGNLIVMLGAGSGTFAAPVSYPVGSGPWDITVADVNDDGIPDVVVGNQANLVVFLGNGDGTLRTGPSTTIVVSLTGSTFTGQLLQGDLNGDGKMDVVVQSSSGPTYALLGIGNGTFTSAITLQGTYTGAGIGDFNRDGRLDLLLINGSSINFLAGNGDGTFQAPVTSPGTYGAGAIATGDFNGDGKLDIVVPLNNNFGVQLGNGDGTFQPVSTPPYGPSGGGFLVADFNGDGKLDILTGSYLLLGNGDGTFVQSYIPDYYGILAAGSFGTGGRVDIIGSAYGGITVEFGVRPSTLTLAATPNPGTLGQPVTLTAAITPTNATGTVTFYDNNAVIGTAPVVSGIAAFTTSSLAANRHVMVAGYLGDTQTESNYTEGLNVFINGSASTVTLAVPAGPATYGQPSKLSATIVPSTATGEITFFEGTKILGSSVLSNGSAGLTTPLLDSGLDPIRAIYTGSSTFTAGIASAVTNLQVNAVPAGAFEPGPSPPAPLSFGPLAATVGDVNRDGIPDLVVVGTEQVCAYLGIGNGTFAQAWCSTIQGSYQQSPGVIVIADFNGDGIPDLGVMVGEISAVFNGNGDGTFTLSSNRFPFSFYNAAAVADMNLDGVPDVIGYGSELVVNLGNGNGTFFTVYGPAGAIGLAASLAIADFNNDGKPDVAVTGDSENAAVFLGNGDGTLQSPVSVVAVGQPEYLIAADFNHDGKADLAMITDYPGSGLSIALGNGDGTFQTAVSYPMSLYNPLGIVSGDFNGDGNPDIVISNNQMVSVYYGNGDGTLQPAVTVEVPLPYLAVADFNGDGRTDLAGLLGAASAGVMVAPPGPIALNQSITLTASVTPATLSGTVSFYDSTTLLGTAPIVNGMAALTTTLPGSDLQQVSAVFHGTGAYASSSSPIIPVTVTAGMGGTFTSAVNYPVGTNPTAIVTGDFNGDGLADLAVANTGSNSVTLLSGQANGAFGNAHTIEIGSQPTVLASGDFNGDGVSDLIVGNALTPWNLTVLLSVNGILTPSGTFTLDAAPAALAAADMNHDGKMDLIVSFGYGVPALLLLGNGNGTFTASPNTLSGYGGIATGDFNADGYPDVVLDGENYFLGSITGSYSENYIDNQNPEPLVIAADFNSDGKLDLASTGPNNSVVLVNLGNGNGTFQSAASFAIPSTGQAIASGDFNGDGKPDIVILSSDGNAGVMFGNGDGTFQPAVEYAAGAQPTALAVGDFNHDGILDLAVTNAGSNTVSILSGTRSTCTYSPSLFPTAVDSSGGAVTVAVTTNSPGCAWSATDVTPYSANPPEIVSGTGTGAAQLTLPANSTGADAAATIVIGTQQLPVTVEATATQFQDVPPGAFAFDAINLLKQNNITDGCTATDFCPTENVTRAQMAVFIIRSIFGGDNFPYPSAQIFNDVPPSSFGYQWIQELSALGITSGCGGGSFCPDDPITREQMAVFIIRARYGATTNFPYSPTPYFTDVPIGAFGFDYIQRMDQDGITTGCTATTFCPLSDVSRAEMAVFIMRGMFNELMPTGVPVVTGQPLGCEVVSGGTATCELYVANASFDNTTQLSASGGLTFSSVQVSDPTNLVFTVTAPAGVTQLTPESVLVTTGTQLLVSPNLIAIEPAQ